MASYSIKIENLAEIKRAFGKAPELTVKYLNRAIEASIYQVAREADPYTPVLTGYLRANNDYQFRNLQGSLIKSADYAIYVHEGTRFMEARPFLVQGMKSAEPYVQDKFQEAVQHVLDDIGKSV